MVGIEEAELEINGVLKKLSVVSFQILMDKIHGKSESILSLPPSLVKVNIYIYISLWTEYFYFSKVFTKKIFLFCSQRYIFIKKKLIFIFKNYKKVSSNVYELQNKFRI